MAQRLGKYTLMLPSKPEIAGYAAVGGKKEGEGPLGTKFDYVYEDSSAGEKTWEKAESTIHGDAVRRAISKAGLTDEQVNVIFAGDLLNQCIGTTFGIRETGIPFAGVYGACSTMALSMAMAAVSVDSSVAETAVASTSSHFCSAEKQFRMPLEYGGQRTPTAQWTATAAGSFILSSKTKTGVYINNGMIGKIIDGLTTDGSNMGAAMSRAAADSVYTYLSLTESSPENFDAIFTGDLGKVGSEIFCELISKDFPRAAEIHKDCGTLLYYMNKKNLNSGASGCGCSASVLSTYVLPRLERGELKNILFLSTGALMSPSSILQGENILGIAPIINIKREN